MSDYIRNVVIHAGRILALSKLNRRLTEAEALELVSLQRQAQDGMAAYVASQPALDLNSLASLRRIGRR
jgi:hypothetical protein